MSFAYDSELVRRVTDSLRGIIADYEDGRRTIVAILNAIREPDRSWLSDGIDGYCTVYLPDVPKDYFAPMSRLCAEKGFRGAWIAMIDAVKLEVEG